MHLLVPVFIYTDRMLVAILCCLISLSLLGAKIIVFITTFTFFIQKQKLVVYVFTLKNYKKLKVKKFPKSIKQ